MINFVCRKYKKIITNAVLFYLHCKQYFMLVNNINLHALQIINLSCTPKWK